MPPPLAPQTQEVVRRAVRSVVDATPALRGDERLRKRVAERMEQVSQAAVALLEEDRQITDQLAQRRLARGQQAPAPMRATTEAGQAVRNLREALDFPTFVTSLISGVFRAITSSTLQQLEQLADLLDGVQASAPAFANAQVPQDSAITYVMQKFDVFSAQNDADGRPVLTLREGSDMPEAEFLKSTLEATDDEVSSIDESDLNGTLLPLVRRKIGRTRQQLLSTMILLGLQRVVVDQGSLHATMELEVDARSAAEQRHASQFDTRVTTSASGSFGAGAWGATASLSATVGYVRSDAEVSRDEMAARAGLRSSVDVQFRTEQIPLDRMANREALAHIRANSRVPEAEWHPQNLLPADKMTGTSESHFAPPPAAPSLPAQTPAQPPPPPPAPGAEKKSGTPDSGAEKKPGTTNPPKAAAKAYRVGASP